MFKADKIKRYIFKPNYYEYENQNGYNEILKIFNNNNLYLYININNDIISSYSKIKQIKKNYIIFSYFNYYNNIINKIYIKIKNYDINNIIKYNDYYKHIFDLRISNNAITKKIDKDKFITYYHIKYIIKDINIIAIRKHQYYNSNHTYNKFYITYYINYYIIIYNNNIKSCRNFNTIFCNFSRNFILFI